MFYEVKNLSCMVDVAPMHFGPMIKGAVTKMLVEKVQWSWIDHEAIEGFAIHAYVPDIGSYDLTKGKIDEDTGSVQFNVKYNAIVMRPQEHDVFDALVTGIEQTGVVCQYGPLYVFVPYSCLGDFKEYDAAGQWRQEEPDADGVTESIRLGSVIRVKATQVKKTTKGMDVFGTIEGDACGLIADPIDE